MAVFTASAVGRNWTRRYRHRPFRGPKTISYDFGTATPNFSFARANLDWNAPASFGFAEPNPDCNWRINDAQLDDGISWFYIFEAYVLSIIIEAAQREGGVLLSVTLMAPCQRCLRSERALGIFGGRPAVYVRSN